MKKGTKTTLVNDLMERPDSLQRDVMVKRAKAGDYHDFESQIPSPKVMLHRDATLAGYEEIAEKAFNGEYDEI